LAYSGAEYRAQLRAALRRDGNRKVENARRLYLITMALVVVYLLIGFPLAVWLLS
jgi:hypothetical protein